MNSNLSWPFSRPHALWDAFQALLQRHPHWHHPQAAQWLGVPEAALYYAMHQVQPENCLLLPPSMAQLLQPIHDWRRIFAVQRNILGVSIHVMRAQLQITADYVRLFDAQQTVHYATEPCRYAFATRENTARGRSVCIVFFDQAGNGLAKLFLRSKRGQELAWPYWQAQQTQCAATPLPVIEHADLSPPTSSMRTQQAFLSAMAGLLKLDNCRIQLVGPGGHASFVGAIRHYKADQTWCHIAEPEFRAHFTAPRIHTLDVQTAPFKSLKASDTQGGSLQLEALGQGAEIWHQQIMEVLHANA